MQLTNNEVFKLLSNLESRGKKSKLTEDKKIELDTELEKIHTILKQEHADMLLKIESVDPTYDEEVIAFNGQYNSFKKLSPEEQLLSENLSFLKLKAEELEKRRKKKIRFYNTPRNKANREIKKLEEKFGIKIRKYK
ncbi:hypothetical protein [Lactococcus lactis]|uniref:hypothetical protein n=1 Tax=Lactococcus lactis TaxID=1358 RepID=UPI00240DB136|nr:hypothetical protein [Lactococcus lactis]WFB95374.1 hypothetical protein PDI73_08245 [Lactococcus lactis]